MSLSLPLLATTTGGRNPDPYCPACLDHWYGQRSSDQRRRDSMHPACLAVLEAIHSTPAQEVA